MYTYIRMIDWETEFRNGKTVYVVRHAVRKSDNSIMIIRTYHFSTRPNKTEAETAGQNYINKLNNDISIERNRSRLDENHFDDIKSQLKELINLGVTPEQIKTRLDNMINNIRSNL